MSYLGDFAASTPGKPAVISAVTGERISYAELNDRSIRLANLLWTTIGDIGYLAKYLLRREYRAARGAG